MWGLFSIITSVNITVYPFLLGQRSCRVSLWMLNFHSLRVGYVRRNIVIDWSPGSCPFRWRWLLPSPFKLQPTLRQFLRPSLMVFLLSVKRKRAACTAGRGLMVELRHSPTKKQWGGSVTFWCGSRSPDPYLWLMDPDPDPTPDPTPFFIDF